MRYAPARPLAFRDELRLKVMHARCANCGACPLVIRALGIMSPSRAVETAEVVALKLAS